MQPLPERGSILNLFLTIVSYREPRDAELTSRFVYISRSILRVS
jgi:hypothetical protein